MFKLGQQAMAPAVRSQMVGMLGNAAKPKPKVTPMLGGPIRAKSMATTPAMMPPMMASIIRGR